MGCAKCVKGLKLTCKFCKGEFCSRCILLEIHGCPNLKEKVTSQLENLKNLNRAVTTSKLLKI